MSDYKLNNVKLLNEYIKYHYPTFKKEYSTGDYIFCDNRPCSECKVRSCCNKRIKGNGGIPIVTSKEYDAVVKEHPEYLL